MQQNINLRYIKLKRKFYYGISDQLFQATESRKKEKPLIADNLSLKNRERDTRRLRQFTFYRRRKFAGRLIIFSKLKPQGLRIWWYIVQKTKPREDDREIEENQRSGFLRTTPTRPCLLQQNNKYIAALLYYSFYKYSYRHLILIFFYEVGYTYYNSK